MDSLNLPDGHLTLGILLTMAPPHSACSPPTTTFDLTLKIFSHKPKWGWMQRKASHTTMNVEMLRKELGDRS